MVFWSCYFSKKMHENAKKYLENHKYDLGD